MDRKFKANDFYFFVGTLLFALFVLVLSSGRSAALSSSDIAVRVWLSALLLFVSFYILDAGRKATRIERHARHTVTVVPVRVLASRRGSRVA